ncbi:MAG: YfcE family phosphodiesterase [Flavobacteriales bacterium]|nr:MAG: YfcE family phosphodiesterase [Flavobacteriales bacterium]
MLKVLLLSDTHGCIDEVILKHINWADEVWHAGDIGDVKVTDTIKKLKPLVAVYGNIDGAELRAEFPLDTRFKREGQRIWMTHIGGYPGRYEQRVRQILQHNPPDIFIAGHSHILKVIYDNKYNLLHLNPGAAGNHGFHKVRTMLRFVLDKGKIKDLEIVEVER